MATPLVTGGGHGFAIVGESPAAPEVSKFYAHPYRFEKPDPQDEYGEGIETANLIRSLKWEKASPLLFATEYLEQSQIIRGVSATSKQYFYAPFELELNAFVTSWEGEGAAPALQIEWAHPVRADRHYRDENYRLISFVDIPERVLMIPVEADRAWIFVCVPPELSTVQALQKVREWQDGLKGSALVTRELLRMEDWRVKPAVTFQSDDERKVWRQSEVVLRMAQNREINLSHRRAHGLILASLPEGMWFVSWVRDMAYAVMALIRMGHQEEARMALEAYFNAGPIGRMQQDVRGYPYQISVVRYFGDGSEEPYFTMEGWPNIEFDGWGLVLWMLGEYTEKFHDIGFLSQQTPRGTIFESARSLIAVPLLGNTDPYGDGLIVAADTSIWEEPQDAAKHFAYTSMAAWKGLQKFADVAEIYGDPVTSGSLREKVELLRRGFLTAFTSQGWIRGTLEESYKNEIDGAVLESLYLGLVDDPAVRDETLKRLEELRMPSGGYRRVRGDTQYEKQEFLFVNFVLGDILNQQSAFSRAGDVLRPMTEKSAFDHGFVPEMYVSELNDQFPGEIGTPTGSIPMVGYGAGIYIRHLLERESALRANTTP